jgi:hypothetical protein
MLNSGETIAQSVKAFYSRSATQNFDGLPLDPTWRPALSVTFTLPAQPSGDYNVNGVVDAADYVVWRNSLGQPISPAGTGADGNSNNSVDPGDLTYWQARFGSPVGSGANSIPEPASLLMYSIGGALISVRRRH